ncbi:MAG TPA: hypothetical protein VMB19_09205 [Silvibacterium sp.]|nr:hypothetical protein [Silvibacterium sp.]
MITEQKDRLNIETIAAEPAQAQTGGTKKSKRIPALDFVKGALVLIMVLYHWINYFFGASDNRYLRFLTPSFIFITGFLISNIYLSKYGIANPHLPRRLLQRGIKILAVFAGLNLARTAVFPHTYGSQMLAEHSSIRSLVDIYVIGSNLGGGQGKAIAFFILVPIAYVLILSALLLMVGKSYRYTFHALCALLFLVVLGLRLDGLQSANAELIAIGLLGIVTGYLPIEKINRFLDYPYVLVVAYLGYLWAITLWNIVYALQVVGVLLSLMILYVIARPKVDPGRIRGLVILLGKYSLLGYIAQIAILQVLHQALIRTTLTETALLTVSFFAAFLLTILSVEATDWTRKRVALVDRIYTGVFG